MGGDSSGRWCGVGSSGRWCAGGSSGDSSAPHRRQAPAPPIPQRPVERRGERSTPRVRRPPAFVCTYCTEGRSVFSRWTENGPAFPESSRAQPRSQEKRQPSSRAATRSQRRSWPLCTPPACLAGGLCTWLCNLLVITCMKRPSSARAAAVRRPRSEAIRAIVRGGSPYLSCGLCCTHPPGQHARGTG